MSPATRVSGLTSYLNVIENVEDHHCSVYGNCSAAIFRTFSFLSVIFYCRLKTQHYIVLISNLKIFKILATCFGCKKPSGQNGTKSRYNEGVHCMGSHIVYSHGYFKNHLLADTKLEKI
jgi:hypothetical protein